jgi:hypothetical protein
MSTKSSLASNASRWVVSTSMQSARAELNKLLAMETPGLKPNALSEPKKEKIQELNLNHKK